MMSTSKIVSRRTVLTGGIGTFALALAGIAPVAHAEGPDSALDYSSPEAFEIAARAYLDLDAQNNEAGLYAWGESYYLNAPLLMYQASGDESYLDRFEARTDHVMASTDEARGVSDYSGRSGPCWRASGNYTAGHGELRLADGSPGIQIRWAGANSAEASASVTRKDDGTFDLTLEHPSSVVPLTGFSADPGSSRYVVDAVAEVYTTGARWTVIDHREEPVAGAELQEGEVSFTPQFYSFAVHTGMVILPMARYVSLVRTSPGLQHRGAVVARMLTAVRRSVRHHRDELHIDSEGFGDFQWPYGAPVPFDGTIQPPNQSHALGAVYAELYAITGYRRHRTVVEAMLKSLRASLQVMDGSYQWPYWPVHSLLYQGFSSEDEVSSYTPSYSAADPAEDIGHAAITLEFIQSVHESGLEDMSQDRRRFASTFIDHVIRTQDSLWYRVDGEVEAAPANAVQSARWLMLHDIEPAIRDQVLRVYQAEPLQPSQGSHALGIAFLNLTAGDA